jgi:sulfate adenylyltransferase
VFEADGKTAPHGGKLVNTMLDAEAAAAKLARCNTEIELTERQSCDVEVLNVGGFSPLSGFMNEDVYNGVVQNMRLPGSNLLFGLPVVFDTSRDDLVPGTSVALNYQGKTLAVLDIESRWNPNKALETKMCYGTSSLEHPGTQYVAMERAHTYVGGSLSGIAMPDRPFPCQTPAEVRASLPANTDVVAFQCRNPVHRAHYELFMRALDADNVLEDGVVLVHPTMGPTQSDDISGVVRYETYKVLQEETKSNARVKWGFLPYSMHMAGPREAIQHLLIRKNYGCTHFIIGRDMAGSKSCLDGEDFYGAYDAQDLAKASAEELGVQTVPSLNLVYTAEEGYITADHAKELGLSPLKLSGTKFRQMLRGGEDIPEWFAFKSVVEVLRQHQ